MDIFSVLNLVGGLALFLYGMNLLGDSLEKLSGGKLESILEKLTAKPIMAVLPRCGSNRGNPVLFSNYCYGSRICKLRHYEAETGSIYYYGCEHRYNCDILDSESVRTGKRQSSGKSF